MEDVPSEDDIDKFNNKDDFIDFEDDYEPEDDPQDHIVMDIDSIDSEDNSSDIDN